MTRTVEGGTGKFRPRETWGKVIRGDLRSKGLSREMQKIIQSGELPSGNYS